MVRCKVRNGTTSRADTFPRFKKPKPLNHVPLLDASRISTRAVPRLRRLFFAFRAEFAPLANRQNSPFVGGASSAQNANRRFVRVICNTRTNYATAYNTMMIDWLTLRIPLDEILCKQLHARIMANMGCLVKFSPDGKQEWQQAIPDWEAIRSDSCGLYWSITADADSVRYLTIGASPSSLLNDGVNVFGDLDIKKASETLIATANRSLETVLPNWLHWQCRRLDVTANYDMGNSAQVKQALAILLCTNGARRKASSDRRGGDSVYFNPSSTLRAGKAYHKGAHLRFQLRKGNIDITEQDLILADRLLRLELMLGSMWFRRLKTDWHLLTECDLLAQHSSFFSSVIGSGDLEVYDMNTLLERLEKVSRTKGRAQAAHHTWALIKTIGFVQVKASMSLPTFYEHMRCLRAAGLTDGDLSGAGNSCLLQFKKKVLVLGEPVLSWEALRLAA